MTKYWLGLSWCKGYYCGEDEDGNGIITGGEKGLKNRIIYDSPGEAISAANVYRINHGHPIEIFEVGTDPFDVKPVGRPKKDYRNFNIKLDASIYKVIEKISEVSGVSKTRICEDALKMYANHYYADLPSDTRNIVHKWQDD